MEGNPSRPPYLPHQIIWRVGANGLSAPVIEPIVVPPPLAGKLTIRLMRGKQLFSVVSFGAMDPFVEVKIGDIRRRSTVKKRGGSGPVWGGEGKDALEFDLTGQESVLRLRC